MKGGGNVNWRCVLIFSVLLCVGIFSNAFAVQRTVSWTPVTQYTDNTYIEPEVLITLRYTITMDNVVIPTCDNVVGNSCVFEHANANELHYFSGKVGGLIVGSWVESIWSPPYPWNCPPSGTPSTVPLEPIILGPIQRP